MSTLKISLQELEQKVLCHNDNDQNIKIRNYNSETLKAFSQMAPIKGKKILDIGASIHGYALLAAIELGVGEYVGIDIDVKKNWGEETVEVFDDGNLKGKLLQMNAENIDTPPEYFDAAITISTFEHFSKPGKVLDEICRNLKKGSKFLATFEPVWTGPKGHHLHHLGEMGGLFPDWGHLFMSEKQIDKWFQKNSIQSKTNLSVNQILSLIFNDSYINRQSLGDIKRVFASSKLKTLWAVDLPAGEADAAVSYYLEGFLPYKSKELMTKGLSILMEK